MGECDQDWGRRKSQTLGLNHYLTRLGFAKQHVHLWPNPLVFQSKASERLGLRANLSQTDYNRLLVVSACRFDGVIQFSVE